MCSHSAKATSSSLAKSVMVILPHLKLISATALPMVPYRRQAPKSPATFQQRGFLSLVSATDSPESVFNLALTISIL
jgi:hypothetical protein